MANPAKIVFLGAGSQSFGLSFIRDVALARELDGSTLVMVTRHVETAARAAALARFLADRIGARLTIEHTIDRRAALDGAQIVVNATAIERNRLWQQDFVVPRRHGFRQTLGENGGPGGLFFTLRTLPMVFDFARDIEALCPDALLINYSNPESRIVLALARYSRVKCLGLCHGLYGSRGNVAEILGLPYERVAVRGAGLNHFQCLVQIYDTETGTDLYPRLREAEKSFDPKGSPFTRKLLRAFGYWLTCGDAHLGEYFAYGWEAGEDGYDFAADERWRRDSLAQQQAVLAGTLAMPDWWTEPSGEHASEVIAALRQDEKRFLDSGIVHNRGTIPNLPGDLAVEVPIEIDAGGVHPVSLGPLPDGIAKLMSMQAQVQQMAVEAAVHGSKELALQALLLDPVVNSIDAAVAVLDELWELNRPHIRSCL